MAPHVIHRWLSRADEAVGAHRLMVFTEVAGGRDVCMADIRDVVRAHYVAGDIQAARLAAHGAVRTAALLREHLPTGKRARSGDLGEILATEIAEQHLGYEVPIRRLRWKDGREMALRGDDIVGVARGDDNRLRLLKGESKSRLALTTGVISAASTALGTEAGRPGRHAVLFVAERLREQGQDDLAADLEDAVLQSFRGIPVEHLLFTLNGNDARALLGTHLAGHEAAQTRYAVSVRITDHGELVHTLYEAL